MKSSDSLLPPASESQKHYSVPEGYFESLPDTVMAFVQEASSAPKTEEVSVVRKKTPRPNRLLRGAFYVAASLTIGWSAYWGISRVSQTVLRHTDQSGQNTAATLTEEDHAYWEYVMDDLTYSQADDAVLFIE